MATKKKQFKIYLDPQVIAKMNLLYNCNYKALSKDKSRHWHVNVSKSTYWEGVFKEHLEENKALLRLFKAKVEIDSSEFD